MFKQLFLDSHSELQKHHVATAFMIFIAMGMSGYTLANSTTKADKETLAQLLKQNAELLRIQTRVVEQHGGAITEINKEAASRSLNLERRVDDVVISLHELSVNQEAINDELLRRLDALQAELRRIEENQ